MKETILAYWRQLNEREQLLVSAAGVFIGLVLIYYALYCPLINAKQAMQRQLSDARSTLTWMKQIEPILVKKDTLKVLSSARLLTVFSTQLGDVSAFKPYPYHLEQAPANRIQLTFDTVPYVAFMTWLNKLSTQYAFTIQQLQLTRTNAPDKVKLLLVIAGS